MAYGVGASLVSLGQNQMKQATQELGAAANQESARNAENTQLEASAKAGRQQLGSTLGALGGFALGAQQGSIGGPWGALIGGVVGAVASGLFD